MVVSDSLSELLSLKRVLGSIVKGTLGTSNHLGGDTDSTLVQDLDGDLVTLADLADNVFLGNLDIVKAQETSRGASNSQL